MRKGDASSSSSSAESNSTPSHAVIQPQVQACYNVAGDAVPLCLTLLPKSVTKADFNKVFEASGLADRMAE